MALGGAAGMVLGGAYQLWVCNRMVFGLPKVWALKDFADLNRREVGILTPLVLGTLILGICPGLALQTMHASIGAIAARLYSRFLCAVTHLTCILLRFSKNFFLQ
jgi:NADH:ubiquinone oxidoreductase subunit 4 (subunit M)